jgi:hypothetical protein
MPGYAFKLAGHLFSEQASARYGSASYRRRKNANL